MRQTPSESEHPPPAGEFEPLEAAALRAAEDPTNKDALAYLFSALYEPVVRYMRGRVQDPATAEDLAQEVFVKVVQKIHLYDGGGINAWIWTVARNVYNDHFRPKRNRGFEQPTSDFWYLDAPSAEMGPAEVAEWNELRQAIQGKMGELPPQQNRVLALRITAGFSPTETAEIMGKSVGTIRVLHCRALAKLRKLMPESDSNLAAYLRPTSDAQRREGVMADEPVRLRERDDAGSMG
ncbi:sigma-70 family RNA polymerase sigma factor [Streptomyces sp. NPDC097619]|uniref:RNA polymerase sigma factor n=1 Tax=Streptomyces sp. NPDC097619 TaxID=3157228 RepID=UPI00332CF54C